VQSWNKRSARKKWGFGAAMTAQLEEQAKKAHQGVGGRWSEVSGLRRGRREETGHWGKKKGKGFN